MPTNEVKEDYIRKGMDANKLFVSGFPIRDDIKRRKTPKEIKDKMMSGNMNIDYEKIYEDILEKMEKHIDQLLFIELF